MRHGEFAQFGVQYCIVLVAVAEKNPWVWMSGAGKPIRRLEKVWPRYHRSLGVTPLVSRYAIVYLRYKSTPSQPLQPHFYPLVASNVPGSVMCMAIGYSLSSFVDLMVL